MNILKLLTGASIFILSFLVLILSSIESVRFYGDPVLIGCCIVGMISGFWMINKSDVF